jgi:hypothetical protein
VWAFAKAGVKAPALFEAAAVEAAKKTLKPQEFAKTAWAFATAGVTAPALFEVMALSIEAKMGEFSPDGLSQMHKVYIHLRLEAPHHALTLVLSRHEAELRAARSLQEPRPRQRNVENKLARVEKAHESDHTAGIDVARPASEPTLEFGSDREAFSPGSSAASVP